MGLYWWGCKILSNNLFNLISYFIIFYKMFYKFVYIYIVCICIDRYLFLNDIEILFDRVFVNLEDLVVL